MRNYGEFANHPGIYFFYNKEGRILYVGKANSLRARLAQHEAGYDIVDSWISFFDQHFEMLNTRIRDAAKHMDGALFDRISKAIAWPLAIIESTLAIDCAYGIVDLIEVDHCSPPELDQREIMYIQLLKPPFNYQYNTDLAGSERWKYYPKDYLKSKALSKLFSHHNRFFAMRTLATL